MRNIFIKSFAILGCILSFAAIGNAQSVKKSEFEIPFEFFVKSKVFPAGRYSIERLNSDNPNFLLLKNTNGKEKTIFLLQNSSGTQTKQPFLTFIRHDEKYFLESIRTNDNGKKHQVLLTVATPKMPKTQKALIFEANKSLPTVLSKPIGKIYPPNVAWTS